MTQNNPNNILKQYITKQTVKTTPLHKDVLSDADAEFFHQNEGDEVC